MSDGMDFQNFGFGRSNRLLKATDYKNVFDQPIKAGDLYFTILAKVNQLGFPRLGLAISKKNARRAVDRNRIKRIARESFRNHKLQMAGIDIVILAKQSAVKTDNKILLASMTSLWKRLNRKFSLLADS